MMGNRRHTPPVPRLKSVQSIPTRMFRGVQARTPGNKRCPWQRIRGGTQDAFATLDQSPTLARSAPIFYRLQRRLTVRRGRTPQKKKMTLQNILYLGIDVGLC